LGVTPGSGGELDYVLRGDGFERMPPDIPMAHEDRVYINNWIAAGVPGL
jgi:hypothetical protein